MTALLQISRRMRQRKNFENRTVFDKVMCRIRWLTFFAHPVDNDEPSCTTCSRHVVEWAASDGRVAVE